MGSWQSKYDTTEVTKQNNSNESDDEESFHDAVDESNTKEKGVQNNLENFQTDAVKSRQPNVLNPNITYETLRDIESELSFYEKVSLAFLIFDQVDIALQFLMIEKDNLIQQTTTNLLVKWAQSESLWKNKIIEGLCIIQNYSILERLGYNKEDMKAVYLPTSPYTAININILSKALYCFAESLSIKQMKLFAKLLEKDFQNKSLQFIEFDDIFVEMYLLHCFSVKYIKYNDMSNIISILKKMDLSREIEMLETVFRMNAPRSNTICESQDENIAKKGIYAAEPTNKVNDCVFDLNSTFNNNSNKNTVTTGNCSQHSVISRSSLVKTYPCDSLYQIDPDNVGICLIINQYTFYVDKNDANWILAPSTPLENRDGTEFDRDQLKDTFAKYNFRIIIKENLTDFEIRNAIRGVMSRFSSKDSCIIVCILSHGEQDSVFGVNSIPVNISELEDILHDTKYPALLGKPKILIIQSCQGKPLQQVVSVEHNYVTDGVSSINPSAVLMNEIQSDWHGVPQKRDLLLLMSTVTGFASVRDPQRGTWFIQELCKVIEEDSDENHFEDIMTTVIGKVSNKIWPKNNKILTMVPQKKSTFSKKLFLTKLQE